MSSANILTIKDLEKIYETDSEKLTVLKGLNLTVEEGSKIIRGHTAKTKAELKQRIENNEWDTLLVRKPVHDEDFIFTPPGIIHGIEGKLMMAEVQQSSDMTYRLYDYDRLVDGKPRELHVQQAIEVTTVPHQEPEIHPVTTKQDGNTHIAYVDNEFFQIDRYKIHSQETLNNPMYSCVVILAGQGTLTAGIHTVRIMQKTEYLT